MNSLERYGEQKLREKEKNSEFEGPFSQNFPAFEYHLMDHAKRFRRRTEEIKRANAFVLRPKIDDFYEKQ